MKTLLKFFTLALLIITGHIIQAQDEVNNPGGFGLKGGIGLSSLNFDNPDQTALEYRNAMKVGGMLGVTYEYRFETHFAIDAELLIANKGSRQKFDLAGDNNRLIIRNNIFTFDLPISVKYYVGDNFNVYAGPYVSYIFAGKLTSKSKINGKETSKESSGYFSDVVELNGQYPLNRVDFGLNIGLEFVTNEGFGVGARFQKGFLDLTNDDYPLSDGKRVTNIGFQFYGLYRF